MGGRGGSEKGWPGMGFVGLKTGSFVDYAGFERGEDSGSNPVVDSVGQIPAGDPDYNPVALALQAQNLPPVMYSAVECGIPELAAHLVPPVCQRVQASGDGTLRHDAQSCSWENGCGLGWQNDQQWSSCARSDEDSGADCALELG